ncbi:hypothetical protein [Taibaiella soli]|uniref:Uncharacterized protein n=1 Tax=Taibaiella soli TaxID=1649169 RepID=A0A2W2BY38_9BACT|nr:hypothetical protein [Taibaiella soli]PZF72763.1 hypothetical protein DN068_12965 [Taibaiella soli]
MKRIHLLLLIAGLLLASFRNDHLTIRPITIGEVQDDTVVHEIELITKDLAEPGKKLTGLIKIGHIKQHNNLVMCNQKGVAFYVRYQTTPKSCVIKNSSASFSLSVKDSLIRSLDARHVTFMLEMDSTAFTEINKILEDRYAGTNITVQNNFYASKDITRKYFVLSTSNQKSSLRLIFVVGRGYLYACVMI